MTCAICGGENASDAAVCTVCGAALTRGLNAFEETSIVAPAPVVPQVVKPVSCAVCATVLAQTDYLCLTCRTPRGAILDPYAPVPGRLLHASALLNPPAPPSEYLEGDRESFVLELPAEVRGGWNWGAFWLPSFWGLAHRTLQTLIVFGLAVLSFSVLLGLAAVNSHSSLFAIIFLGFWVAGFPFSIWFGLRGNEWAWRNRRFQSVEEFRKVQKIWGNWAKVLFALNMAIIAVSIVVAVLT